MLPAIGDYKSYDDRQRREAQGPILNRIGQFLAIPEIRSVVSHPFSTLKLRTAIDENYIMIVNLSKGTVGNTPSAIFGSLLASSIKTALMSREDTPEDERRPLAFDADEFHNYGTIAWAEMLSECRKYGLQLTLAHQFAAQLHPQVLSAVRLPELRGFPTVEASPRARQRPAHRDAAPIKAHGNDRSVIPDLLALA